MFIVTLECYNLFSGVELSMRSFFVIIIRMQQDIILRYMLDAKYAVLADILHNIQI